MTLFDVDEPPPATPRKGVAGGVSAPSWADYAPKVPRKCDHCVQVALESLQAGKSLPNVIRTARRKRRQDGENLHLCYPHAQAQAAADEMAIKEAA